MMKHILTIAALLIASLSYGQGIWSKSATNTIINRGKDDSVRIIPRDTLPTNNALYNGSPVGNYGRIAAKHGKFYFHDSIYNRRVALYDEVITWSSPLIGLASESDEVIQPTDTLFSALGKLQAQINAAYGKFFEIGDTSHGQLIIQNPLNTNSITIVRPNLGLAGDTTQANVGWKTKNGRDIGWIGLGKNEPSDTNAVDWINYVSRNIITSADSAETVFATWNASAPAGEMQRFYTFAKQGKWRFLKNGTLDLFSQSSGPYAYTIDVQGPSRLDTVSVTGTLDLAKGLTSQDALLVTDGTFLGALSYSTIPIVGSITSHPFGIVTAGIERIRVLTNGFTGFGTTSPDERIHVAGNAKITGTLEVGGVKWITGSGSPEGAITAPAGSLYSNTAGGAGATFYVKESGAGNTGWVAK